MCSKRVDLKRWFVALPLLCSFFTVGCPIIVRPSYDVQIFRVADTPEEEAYIAIAESVCPSRADVLVVFEGDPPEVSEECLWWYMTIRTGLRIPYAITDDAIDWYTALIEDWQDRQVPINASLFYGAHVIPADEVVDTKGLSPGTVAVVMTMEVFVSRGPNTGEGFYKRRIVIVSPDGTPLAVFDDGITEVGYV